MELIHPDDRKMVFDNYVKRLKGEVLPDVYSFRMVSKNGRYQVGGDQRCGIHLGRQTRNIEFLK